MLRSEKLAANYDRACSTTLCRNRTVDVSIVCQKLLVENATANNVCRVSHKKSQVLFVSIFLVLNNAITF